MFRRALCNVTILTGEIETNRITMTSQIAIVLALTFLINLITTLSYSVRIVGIRTGRIAVSFALFNILVLVSRTANGFQAPLLASTIEKNINSGAGSNLSISGLSFFHAQFRQCLEDC